jgi:hypothetical protein
MSATPDPSVPLSAIRALVQQWREEADAIDARAKRYCYGGELDGDMLDEDISHLFQEATVTRQRADQLAALCPAPPEDRK